MPPNRTSTVSSKPRVLTNLSFSRSLSLSHSLYICDTETRIPNSFISYSLIRLIEMVVQDLHLFIRICGLVHICIYLFLVLRFSWVLLVKVNGVTMVFVWNVCRWKAGVPEHQEESKWPQVSCYRQADSRGISFSFSFFNLAGLFYFQLCFLFSCYCF